MSFDSLNLYNNARKSRLLLLLSLIFILVSCSPKHREYSSPRKYKPRKSRTVKVDNRAVKKDYQRSILVRNAKKYQGIPYKYGGKKPSTGFDCSGLSTYVYKESGIDIAGSSSMLAKKGRKISKGQASEGDLAFFGSRNKVSHVGIIVKNQDGKFEVIHATSKGGVRKDDINSSKYWSSRYLFSRSILN